MLLSAQERPVPSTRLTLEEAIDEALVHNLALRIDRYVPLIAADSVVIAESAFDPVLTAGLSHSESEEDDFITTSDSRSYTAGVSKRLALTNATLTARTSLSRSDGTRYDEDFDQVVGGNLNEVGLFSLGVTQPLLRDFGGEVATADLEKARADQRIAQLQLRDGTLALIASVEQAYWNLAEASARRGLRETNRELAERLLEETKERQNLGLVTALEVIQAEANLAQRDEDILVAEQAVDDAKDALLRFLGRMEDDLVLSADLVVATLPPIASQTPELATAWRDALGSDYALLRQREVVTQRELDRILARNTRKPELDLNLSATVSGRSEANATDSLDRLLDRERESWNVGLSFNLPLGQRAAKAGWRNADRRLDQAELQLVELKQDLLQKVRSTWRELDTRKNRLRAAELVLRLQEQTFEQERVKLDEGLSTLRDLLEIQRDLDNARLSLLAARAAAIQAEVTLERLRGTLLERHGLTWSGVSQSVSP